MTAAAQPTFSCSSVGGAYAAAVVGTRSGAGAPSSVACGRAKVSQKVLRLATYVSRNMCVSHEACRCWTRSNWLDLLPLMPTKQNGDCTGPGSSWNFCTHLLAKRSPNVHAGVHCCGVA